MVTPAADYLKFFFSFCGISVCDMINRNTEEEFFVGNVYLVLKVFCW